MLEWYTIGARFRSDNWIISAIIFWTSGRHVASRRRAAEPIILYWVAECAFNGDALGPGLCAQFYLTVGFRTFSGWFVLQIGVRLFRS